MEIKTLEDLYDVAAEHAALAYEREVLSETDEYHPTREPRLTVEGIQTDFHIDNSPSIYLDMGELDDLVYVDTQQARDYHDAKDGGHGAPYVTKEEFIDRVEELAREVRGYME